jgi:hypothetical protein
VPVRLKNGGLDDLGQLTSHLNTVPRLKIHVVLSPMPRAVAYPGIFFRGGVQQIQLWTEDRENGDLGAAGP